LFFFLNISFYCGITLENKEWKVVNLKPSDYKGSLGSKTRINAFFENFEVDIV